MVAFKTIVRIFRVSVKLKKHKLKRKFFYKKTIDLYIDKNDIENVEIELHNISRRDAKTVIKFLETLIENEEL